MLARLPQRDAVPTRTAGTENFPVLTRLVAPRLRHRVAAFYRFARAADDVADDPRMEASQKLAALDAMEAGLHDALGADAGQARALLGAFRQDARGAIYRTWADLHAYCAMSAVPVGRFLLALYGEEATLRREADPLCAALQVLNHLQDLREDRIGLGRVYLPHDWIAEAGADPADLGRTALTPGLRVVVDRALDACGGYLDRAETLPRRIRSPGLRGQAATTLWLARRLAARLRSTDPLACRVALSKLDFVRAGLVGLRATLPGGR